MLKQIENLDSSLLEIQPVLEYLKQFSTYEITKVECEDDNGEIGMLGGNESLRIIFLNIGYAKWWSIYRYHQNGVKYEQIDTIIYNEVKDNAYNNVIKYSGHIEDDKYSHILCSSFLFLDQSIVNGWEKTRVVPISDLYKIQYTDSMNLTELICMTDSNCSNIVKKEDINDIKVLSLRLKKYI